VRDSIIFPVAPSLLEKMKKMEEKKKDNEIVEMDN